MRTTQCARALEVLVVKVQEGISETIAIFRIIVTTVEASHKRDLRRAS